MEVLHKKRPIGWLIDKGTLAIMDSSVAPTIVNFMYQFNMTPNNIYEYYEGGTSTEFAQSARWLSIIYRDYGLEVFEQVIELVKTINAEDIRHEKD